MTIKAVVMADIGSHNLDVLTSSQGEPLLIHTLRRLQNCGVDSILLILSAERVNEFRATVTKASINSVKVIAGRGNLRDSLREASKQFGTINPEDVVLIHDGTRAFAPSELFRAVEEKIREGSHSVAPVLPVTDTIKNVDKHGILTNAVDRALLRETQTPQGFSSFGFRSLLEDDPGSEVGSVRSGKLVTHTIPGHPLAIRIETLAELAAAEAMLATE